MSAAFASSNLRSDLSQPGFPASGQEPIPTAAPVRSPDRPIRFPHIPSIDQTPPGMAQYLQRQQQALRIDAPHPTPGQQLANSSQQQATSNAGASPAVVLDGPAHLPARRPAVAPQSTAQVATAPEVASLPQPTRIRPVTPQTENWRSLSTQVEQIAEYLRRRRNELETEQTDLKLNALMQEAALLQEREQLRGQQLNIQMVQATLEILRRQLLELGNSLADSLPTEHSLLRQFESVCQAYYDAASVAKLLDAV